jgi:diadenosine tetraphosphate (Ap4A) HIT family hydrolase
MKTDEHVNIDNARPGVYTDVIKKIEHDKICPFCPEHLHSIHPNPIEEKEYWIVTDNAYPYKPKKEHVLLIHKTHMSNISELSTEAWNELGTIINDEQKKRNISGGTLIMRFGETKYTGASVTHLHAHLFQSDPDNKEYDKTKGILTRIG